MRCLEKAFLKHELYVIENNVNNHNGNSKFIRYCIIDPVMGIACINLCDLPKYPGRVALLLTPV